MILFLLCLVTMKNLYLYRIASWAGDIISAHNFNNFNLHSFNSLSIPSHSSFQYSGLIIGYFIYISIRPRLTVHSFSSSLSAEPVGMVCRVVPLYPSRAAAKSNGRTDFSLGRVCATEFPYLDKLASVTCRLQNGMLVPSRTLILTSIPPCFAGIDLTLGFSCI